MPENTEKHAHPTNPVAIDKWSEMSDAADFYVVQHDGVGAARTGRIYQVSNGFGSPVTRLPVAAGDTLGKGYIVSAKTFGPGADLQRLVDLGAIRPATKWEADTVHAELTGEADKARKDHAEKAKKAEEDKAKADAEAKAKADAVKVEPVKPVDVKPVAEPDKK